MGRFARCLQRELQHVPATDLGGSRSCTAANTVQPVTVKSDVQKVPSGRHVRGLDVSWRGQGLELVYLCILQAPVCRWQNGSATKGRVGPNEGLMSSPIVKASVELLLLHWKRRSKKFGRLGVGETFFLLVLSRFGWVPRRHCPCLRSSLALSHVHVDACTIEDLLPKSWLSVHQSQTEIGRQLWRRKKGWLYCFARRQSRSTIG